jgi:diguanylate cyclase (GGDEF)-like protein
MTKNKPYLKPASYISSKNTWRWALIGGLIGFFVIHPCVMVTAHLMFQSGPESNYSIAAIIFLEFSRIFSFQMLPWGLSFAFVSALSGLFFGRNRQATRALQESEERFRKLSITDDLTGIYNSRHFFKQLKNEIDRTNRYEHPLSLLILDLDNFKNYNDHHGHVAGDEVLAKIGKILRNSLRKTDSAYRYGGEEFTVILPETGGNEAGHFAERIRQSIEKHAFANRGDRSLSVTASIGIAQYKPGEEISAFIKSADENMYTAKKQGKNRVFFPHLL